MKTLIQFTKIATIITLLAVLLLATFHNIDLKIAFSSETFDILIVTIGCLFGKKPSKHNGVKNSDSEIEPE